MGVYILLNKLKQAFIIIMFFIVFGGVGGGWVVVRTEIVMGILRRFSFMYDKSIKETGIENESLCLCASVL